MAKGSEHFKLQLEIALLSLCDATMEEYNPCHMKDGDCLRGNPVPCCSGRIWNLEWRKENGRGCKYMVEGKCLNPNLKCKSWICQDALKTIDPECLGILQAVEEIGKNFGLIGRPFLGQPHVRD